MTSDELARACSRIVAARERAERCVFRGYAPEPRDPYAVTLAYRNGTDGPTAGRLLGRVVATDVPALCAIAEAAAGLVEARDAWNDASPYAASYAASAQAQEAHLAYGKAWEALAAALLSLAGDA